MALLGFLWCCVLLVQGMVDALVLVFDSLRYAVFNYCFLRVLVLLALFCSAPVRLVSV